MRGHLPYHTLHKSEIKKKKQQPIGYEWTQNASFRIRFSKNKKTGEEPPPPCERKGKTSPVSRISEIGTLTAKITHNFGEKSTGNRQKWAKNAPFASVFQKFSRGPGDPPTARE